MKNSLSQTGYALLCRSLISVSILVKFVIRSKNEYLCVKHEHTPILSVKRCVKKESVKRSRHVAANEKSSPKNNINKSL